MKMWQHWLGLAVEADDLAAAADRVAAVSAAVGDVGGRDVMRKSAQDSRACADRARRAAAQWHQREEEEPTR